QTQLAEVANRVPATESISQQEARLAELTAQLSALDEENSARRDGVSRELSALGARLAGLEVGLGEAAGERSAADERVRAELAASADERASLVASVHALEERLSALVPSTESVSQVEARLANLGDQLSALGQQTATGRDGIANELSALADRLAGLE